jgi:hypothetical protein
LQGEGRRVKGRSIPYSAAEMAWLEANRLMVISAYAAAFNAKFGRAVDPKNLHALRKRKGWLTGRTGFFEKGQAPHNKGKPCEEGRGGKHPNARRTQFRKGNEPHNTRYLGHERVSKDGYVEISVAETNPHTGYSRRYVLKHRWLWEQANGPIPASHALKCLDGDKQNTDPSNWEAVPRALLPRLAGKVGRYKRCLAYDDAATEVRPALLAIAKLSDAARRARDGNPKGEKPQALSAKHDSPVAKRCAPSDWCERIAWDISDDGRVDALRRECGE